MQFSVLVPAERPFAQLPDPSDSLLPPAATESSVDDSNNEAAVPSPEAIASLPQNDSTRSTGFAVKQACPGAFAFFAFGEGAPTAKAAQQQQQCRPQRAKCCCYRAEYDHRDFFIFILRAIKLILANPL
jgi:hypothetical protein